MPYGRSPSWSKEDLKKYTDEMKGITVSVDISFEGKQCIIALPRMERLLRKARVIAVADCECRTMVKGCDAPLDVCLYLNEAAESHVKRGLAKMVDIEGALGVLKRSHEAGLVHVAYTNRDESDPTYICSCCACCCHSLTAMMKYGFHEAIVASESVAVQDNGKCDDCGSCVSRCHFKAREMRGEKLSFDRAKCFGCGVCVSSCPRGAIALTERR